MFLNYITTAWRNIARHKLYAVINIGGLALALAACILILLFVRFETSFDSWLPDADQIYRLETTVLPPGQPPEKLPRSMGLVKGALDKDFPSISEVTRIYFSRPAIRQDNVLFADIVAFVDPNFFSVFDLPMVSGARAAAVEDNSSLILSETAAEKYFGDQDPINQTLVLNGQDVYRVVGVMKDFPDNSHLDFDFIALFDTGRYTDRPYIANTWRSTFVYTYLKIESASDAAFVQQALPDFVERNRPQTENSVQLSGVEFNLMPIRDIHLHSPGGYGMSPTNSSEIIYVYSAIAALILLIAITNYINLATARAILRAREIGLRKVMGGKRSQLIFQFLSESYLITFIAFGLGLFFVYLGLPWYDSQLGKVLVFNLLNDPAVMLWLTGFLIITGFFGGLYPAFYLSSFRPARVLRSARFAQSGKSHLRNALVLIQFAISIALIIITVGIFDQNRFVQNFDPGYETEGLIILQRVGNRDARVETNQLVARLENLPSVENASLSLFAPTDDGNYRVPVKGPQQLNNDEVSLNALPVDDNFFQTLGVGAVSGRLFSENFPTDFLDLEQEGSTEGNVILNMSAVRQLGYDNPTEALYKTITAQIEEFPTQLTIVGIVPDFNLQSVHYNVKPTFYFIDPTRYRRLSLRVNSANPQNVMQEIASVWSSVFPDTPLRAAFLDDMILDQYMDEQSQMQTFLVFAILAVSLACFGLFGLAAFNIARRTKEVGLRKVMGASSLEIIRLMVWQFSKPVIIANLIAWPAAWFFLNDWLTGFVYRINLSVLYFVGAGVLALFIAWVTVTGHAYAVAKNHPSKALRCE